MKVRHESPVISIPAGPAASTAAGGGCANRGEAVVGPDVVRRPLADLRGSTSWKVTAPLLRFSDSVKALQVPED